MLRSLQVAGIILRGNEFFYAQQQTTIIPQTRRIQNKCHDDQSRCNDRVGLEDSGEGSQSESHALHALSCATASSEAQAAPILSPIIIAVALVFAQHTLGMREASHTRSL